MHAPCPQFALSPSPLPHPTTNTTTSSRATTCPTCGMALQHIIAVHQAAARLAPAGGEHIHQLVTVRLMGQPIGGACGRRRQRCVVVNGVRMYAIMPVR